jgi:tRNA (mo5U34)-methyltransferase
VASRDARRRHNLSQLLYETGWYHSFELPDGTFIEGVNPLTTLRERFGRFPIPADLRGKRVLDIGAWDGWFSFEAERRGASVVAIDCVEVPNFLEIRDRLRSRVDYRVLDFYDLPAAGLGQFDYVFFTGVLYHLKHPLLALEIVCALATDAAIVESFVIDGDEWRDHADEMPYMEFYETDELGDQFDNWIGPTVGCLRAMSRAAGFARVELLRATGSNAMLACHRKWEAPPDAPRAAAPELLGAMNTRSLGINFSTRAEEYVSCWFRAQREIVRREDLRLEVGGFGVPGLYTRREPDGTWFANFRLPPGLPEGWAGVRLRFADSGFGSGLRIAIDLAPRAETLTLHGVADGVTWERNRVTAGGAAYLSCWVSGLPENCDRANIRATLGSLRLPVVWVGAPEADGGRQFNIEVPARASKGEQRLRIECGGAAVETPVTVR